MNSGVVYIAVGKKNYLRECIHSARSLKRHCPDIHTTLFTNHADVRVSCFDRIKVINNDMNPMKIKVRCLHEFPYEYNLFLDSDTEVRKPLYEMFELLEQYDLALAHAPLIDRNYMPAKLVSYDQPGQYNTGVVLYKRSNACQTFFDEWLKVTLSQDENDMWAGHYCDQFYFNKLIEAGFDKTSHANLGLLSNKLYNVRPPMIMPLKQSGEFKNSKILHCHDLHRSIIERQFIRLMKRLKKG